MLFSPGRGSITQVSLQRHKAQGAASDRHRVCFTGNREMYMNCAAVTVTNGGSGLTGPTPFVANANVNECKTIENIDVVFPDPGSVVHYGGSYASTRPTTPAGYVGSNCVGPGASASPSGSAKASSSASPSKTSAQQPTTAAASTPVVNEHVVSTSTVLTSTGDVTTSTLQDSASSTGTASASAVTTTTTSTSGKVSQVFTAISLCMCSLVPTLQTLVKVCRRKTKRSLEIRRSRMVGGHGSAWSGVW